MISFQVWSDEVGVKWSRPNYHGDVVAASFECACEMIALVKPAFAAGFVRDAMTWNGQKLYCIPTCRRQEDAQR